MTTDPDGSAPDPRRWRALPLLCVTNFMIILDAQIVILALPAVERDLGLSVESGQWILTGYLLAFGGLLLLGGRLADLWGRRRVYLIGTALFLVSSLLCGLAWSGAVLIGARVLQGVSAAAMAPSALALLTAAFPEQERDGALAWWSGVGGVGATAALLIGGTVTTGLGWQWIFLLNIPVAAALLGFGRVLLRESRDRDAPRAYDPVGALTGTLGLVLLIAGVVTLPDIDTAPLRVLGLLGSAAILLMAFAWWEQRSAAPLVPLRIFRSRRVVGGNLSLLAIMMVAFGTGFTLSAYAQQILGWSALRFGVATTALTLLTIVGAYLAQYALGKVRVAPVAVTALVLLAAGSLLLSRVPLDGEYVPDLLPGLLLLGLGIGGGPVAAIAAALSGAQQADIGAASGVNTACFQIGGAFGTAVMTGVIAAAAEGSTDPARLLTGFQHAFVACVAIAVAGLVAAALLLRERSDH